MPEPCSKRQQLNFHLLQKFTFYNRHVFRLPMWFIL